MYIEVTCSVTWERSLTPLQDALSQVADTLLPYDPRSLTAVET